MKNRQKLISVILNCFNGSEYLEQALTCIQNQTYKNWELIFWDNKSTDGSKRILSSFKNKKFRYFLAKKHTSLYTARNLAISKAKGEFISFIDADDLWENDKLEKQIKLFKDKNVALVYGNQWIKKESIDKKKIYFNYISKQGYIFNDLIKNYNIGILTVLIRKKFLKNLKKKFDDKYKIIGDFDLFIKLSKKFKFMVVQTPIATYRIHSNNYSILNKDLEATELKEWLKINKKLLNNEQYKIIKKRMLQIKFVNIKYTKSFFKTSNFFIFNFYFLFNFKNIVILFFPRFFLKKFIWFF